MTITSQLARISWETHSLCSLLQDKNIFHFLLQSIKIWGAKHVENMSAEWQKMLKMCADTHFAWRLASITLQMTYSKDNSLTTPVSDLVSLNWVIVLWPKLWQLQLRAVAYAVAVFKHNYKCDILSSHNCDCNYISHQVNNCECNCKWLVSTKYKCKCRWWVLHNTERPGTGKVNSC